MTELDETAALLTEPELTELFAADPTAMTDFEFRKLVLVYRAQRKEWATLEAKPKGKAAKSTAPAVVTLDDLGLN